jgi:hemerythrin-like domain-containing protein
MARRLIESIPEDLLTSPLDYILAEHFRQRLVCNLLEQVIVETPPNPDMAAELLRFLDEDLALHVADEEEDLFPMLRRKAHPEDDIGQVMDLLSAEHARDVALLPSVMKALERIRNDRPVAVKGKLARDIRAFARGQRRHLALENAVVIPVARLRLSNRDLAELGLCMSARRRLGSRPEGMQSL